MASPSFGHPPKRQILSGILLSLLAVVAFLPAHAPAGQIETQSFSAAAAARYNSPVAAILASPDDVPEIRAGSEGLAAGTTATRDSAPLNGPEIASPLFFAASSISTSFAGRAFRPLYQILDIPPPYTLA